MASAPTTSTRGCSRTTSSSSAHADRRLAGQPRHRAAAVPRGRGPGPRHLDLHQLPGRLGHRRPGDPGHDALRQAATSARSASGRRRAWPRCCCPPGPRASASPCRTPGSSSTSRSGGSQGQAADIDIQAREILRMRETLNQILVETTGQTLREDRRGHRPGLHHDGGPGQGVRSDRRGDPQARLEPGRSRGKPPMSRKKAEGEGLKCSFCNKSQRDVRKLIAGPTVYICDECVDICLDIIAEERESEEQDGRVRLPKPVEIKTFLDEYVIGQDEAKKRSPSPSTTTTSATRSRPAGATTSSSRSRTSCSSAPRARARRCWRRRWRACCPCRSRSSTPRR